MFSVQFFFSFKNAFSKIGKRMRFHCFEKSKIENDSKTAKKIGPNVLKMQTQFKTYILNCFKWICPYNLLVVLCGTYKHFTIVFR